MRRRIDGTYCRRFKGWNGRIYWVKMDREEVIQERLYSLGLVLMPLITVFVWAWAAGMIG